MTGFTIRRVLIVLFVVLFPFYLFPSGGAQISFALIALGCALDWRRLPGMLNTPDRRVLLPLLLFIGYTVAVNAWYSALYPDRPLAELPLMRSLPYVFGYGLFSLVLLHLRQGGRRELSLVIGAVFVSVLVQTALSAPVPVASSAPLDRIDGYFNNPNQLGYFALASLVMGAAFIFRGPAKAVWTVVFTLCCLYLTTISLSNAAIGSVALLGAFAIVAMRARRSIVAAMAVAGLAFVLLVAFNPSNSHLLDMLQWRASSLERKFHDLGQDRRLTRFRDYPSYLVLGAGQGLTDRFDTEGEVHSTPGTVLFSYGVPGSVLFAIFLVNVVRGDARRSTLLLIPLLAYGMVHNGLRFPWFWLCLCVIYYCASTPLPAGKQV